MLLTHPFLSPMIFAAIGPFAREVWPFVIALTIALFLVTYLPEVSLWFPNLVMPAK